MLNRLSARYRMKTEITLYLNDRGFTLSKRSWTDNYSATKAIEMIRLDVNKNLDGILKRAEEKAKRKRGSH